MIKTTTFRDEALELLRNRPRLMTVEEVSEKTGVSVGWIRSFMRGAIKNPGVNNIEAIRNLLLNNKAS